MTPTPTAPTFEHHAPGRLGVGERAPRLSWQVATAPAGYRQHAAEVEIAVADPDGTRVVTTHVLDGPEQVLVAWPAEPLRSRQAVAARVRVHDGAAWGPWGETGRVETGLLEPGDWAARFVGPAGPEAASGRPPGRLRTEVVLPGDVRHARLYLSAQGLAEAEINGVRVGDEELTPGWTSYRYRLRYATFDVTGHLTAGANAIGIWLGDGWWRGRLGFGGGVEEIYGDTLAALAQLEVTLTDGTRVVAATDGSWLAGPGPIVSSGLYAGERFDARAHDPAWSRPGYVADGWSPAAERGPHAPLVAPTGPPVRCTEELLAVDIQDRGDGRWVLDFGQNHSGRLRVRAHGAAGHEITLRHAEVLEHGELCLEPLRTAEATDVLVLAGGPIEWEPRFTQHGYRFVEVSGWSGPLGPDDVVSRVLHTDLARTGWFRSSEPLVNRFHENVVWSLRSNVVDIPTDCPQRDERLGWTGDLQVFAPTAAFLYDVSGFLGSWLADLALEQRELDWVPPYVPYLPLEPFASLPQDPMAVWGDVAVLTPDALHRATGDTGVLRRQLDSAVRWLEHVERGAGPGRICHGTEQLGDWLDPAAPPENPFEATTDRYLVATAYFAHSARRLAAVAAVLGEDALAARYAALADEVRAAYGREYVLPGGRLTSDSQTAYALTTVFGLWPDEAARAAGTARLAELVRDADGAIATGFAGTPVVTDALTIGGHLPEAYLLLEREECPSWLYTVRMGGTTTWERWDSLKPDGTVNSPTMTSFNHYALGAVADWMHRVVAGIEPAEPGYRRIRFAPRPGGGFTSAGATHRTPYGVASVDWRLADGAVVVDVEVPVGATGVVELPDGRAVEVGHGRHRLESAPGPVAAGVRA
ncbi:alpha-L-rhamnosidase [Cellulomonas hominis]|uniref:alpha-L-rhamnosidase n=1 Tax=Cellulomonas hominis TaxID=156981 RepID=UPI00144454AB|nr:alpha-L-rhamnosidase [Cellulomonas hominis]NKY10426.1 family 78 glycoside hydrolase catalytic domain [Cellulomonas hominis]